MGGSHYLDYVGSGTNFDFFHIGALLVVIMAIVTGIALCVAVVGVCCFHWLDDYQDKKKTCPHTHHHVHSHRNSSAVVPHQSNRDVLRNSFIRNYIIRFDEYSNPGRNKALPCAPANIQEEGPPPYDLLFPAVPPVIKMPSPPTELNTTVDVTVTNEDRNSRDASTRL